MTDIVKILRAMNEEGVNHVSHAADVIERQEMKLGGYREALEQCEQELDACCDRKMAYITEIKGLGIELTASQANYLFAMRLLAESQAREKVLRDALEYYMTNGVDEHLYYTVKKALSQPVNDTALQDLIIRERANAISTYKGLKALMEDDTAMRAALAAEREKCLSIIRNLLNASEPDDFALDALNAAENAIRALGD